MIEVRICALGEDHATDRLEGTLVLLTFCLPLRHMNAVVTFAKPRSLYPRVMRAVRGCHKLIVAKNLLQKAKFGN